MVTNFSRSLQSFILVLIVLVAFFIRFYNVSFNPPSLNWDEVSIGYNAYSVLKTGKDEWGEFLPVHFKSYGEFKLPVHIYGSIPAIALFGLNEFGVRITPVLYGTLTVLLTYLLAKKIFKNEQIGLIASFLLAISPWHIHLTRASFESSFSVFFVVLGILLFVKGFEKKFYWMLSMIPFALAVYTYNSARVFVPLFIFSLVLLYRNEFLKFKKHILLALAFFFLLMIPLIPFVLSGDAAARYKLVSITNEPGLIPRINERRGNSGLPKPFDRLVHNKVTYISFYFAKNYLAHFNPEFLFISGAGHKQHHVQNVGQLYLIQFPFLVIGLYFLLKNKNDFRGLLIAWVLIAFVPVATTQDSIPNALRTLIAAPPLQIISALGICNVFERTLFNKKVLYFTMLSIGTIFAASLCIYLKNYHQVYPVAYSKDWQYGNKQAVEFIKESYDQYDLIVYTRHYGEPHMFTLFYSAWDPEQFISDPNLERFETFDWIRVLRFDKFYFPDLGDLGTRYGDILRDNPEKKILFIGKPGDFPVEANKLKTINFLNGESAFEIVEN